MAEVFPVFEGAGDACVGHQAVKRDSGGGEAGVDALPERRVGGEGEHVREVLDEDVDEVDGFVATAHADVNMQAEGDAVVDHPCEAFFAAGVALIGKECVFGCFGRWVCGQEGQVVAEGFCEVADAVKSAHEGIAGVCDALGDVGFDFDH